MSKLNIKTYKTIAAIIILSFVCTACGGGSLDSDNGSPANNAGPAPSPGSPNFTLSVTKSGSGSGSVSSPVGIACGSTCSASIAPDTSVTLTATPSTGSTFAGWSGGVCTGTSPCTTIMSQARSVNAVFALIPSGGNAIILSLVPSRITGVAPLSVFFDASATSDNSATSRPFHDLEYRWSFGDASAGNWANGAQPGINSKNSATGPVASHVFETPGTYVVALTALDGTNNATTSTTITVQNPDTVFALTTACIANTTPVPGIGGCPSGAHAYAGTSNFAAAMTTALSAGYKRILFKRGDIFAGSTDANIHVNGPGIIGAYGTGAKPVINGPGTTPVISLGTRGSGLYTDWRIMDLYLNGQNNQVGENVGIGALGQFNQVTILRVDVVGTSTGYAASHWTLTSGQQSFDQWAIHDSTAAGVPNCNWTGHYICNWRIYIVGTRWSMQGNALDNLGNPSTLYAGGSHVIRTEMLQNSVISNNTLKGAGDFQLAIKLHAWAWDGSAGGNATAATYTEKVIIADNKIEGGANPWMLSLGPQDEITDERVRDVIVERNWFTSNSRTQLHMHINSSGTTIRNNICDLTNAPWHTCVSISQWGITPAPDNNRVYNNTFFSGSSGDFIGVEIGTATDTQVQNNLASAPLATDPVMISGTGTGLVQSNNLLNNSPSALFVSATPSTPANFGLKTGVNPARDTGASVPVLSDFFLSNRPIRSTIDIGAVEGL